MPSLVAAQGLGEVVPSRTERAIALDVRQRGRGELDFAEATGELVLLVLGHVLAGEHQQRVLEPQLGQLGDGRIAHAREEDIADDRPERRVQRLDPDRPHDVAHAAMVRLGIALPPCREGRHSGMLTAPRPSPKCRPALPPQPLGDEGDDDVGGVAVEVLASAVVHRCGAGSACRAASWTSRRGRRHRAQP